MKSALLLCAAMSVAGPALAQTAAPSAQTAPMSQTAPAQTSGNTESDASAAAQTAPTAQQPAAQTPADTAQASATPAQTTGQPSAGATQVAQVVDAEFTAYDKNKDGVLSKAEFGDWMIALKTASDPNTKADTPAAKTWIGRAFASADKDRSSTVSKTELTGFLSQGRS